MVVDWNKLQGITIDHTYPVLLVLDMPKGKGYGPKRPRPKKTKKK